MPAMRPRCAKILPVLIPVGSRSLRIDSAFVLRPCDAPILPCTRSFPPYPRIVPRLRGVVATALLMPAPPHCALGARTLVRHLIVSCVAMLRALRVLSRSKPASRHRCCAITALTSIGACLSFAVVPGQSCSRLFAVLSKRRFPFLSPVRRRPLPLPSVSRYPRSSLLLLLLLPSCVPLSSAFRVVPVRVLRVLAIPGFSQLSRLRLGPLLPAPCAHWPARSASALQLSRASAPMPLTGFSPRVPSIAAGVMLGWRPSSFRLSRPSCRAGSLAPSARLHVGSVSPARSLRHCSRASCSSPLPAAD